MYFIMYVFLIVYMYPGPIYGLLLINFMKLKLLAIANLRVAIPNGDV